MAQLKPYIQYYSYSAELILQTSGRGSFIAPAVGFLHYGPSCYLYDHVCNFNYQGTVAPPCFRCCLHARVGATTLRVNLDLTEGRLQKTLQHAACSCQADMP